MRRTLVLVGLALILAAGCSNPLAKAPKQSAGSQTTADAPVTIKLGVVAGLRGKPELEAVVTAFQDQFPKYRVEMVNVAGSPDAVFQVMSHGDVDLIQGGGAHLIRALKENAMADLTPYLGTTGVSTSALDWFLDTVNEQGKTLELPYFVDPQAVIYNSDLAKAAGVTMPEAGWTWDQFREAAQRLTRQSGVRRTWGMENDGFWVPVNSWVKQAGGPPQNQPSETAFANALHYFSDLIFTDHSMVPPRFWGGQGQPPEDLFGTSQAAMTIMELPNPRTGQKLPFEWGVAPLPNHPGARPAMFVEASTLAMSSHAPNPEGAWEFLKFAMGSDAAKVLAATGSLPCYPSEEAKLTWLQRRSELPQSVRSLLDTQWFTMYWHNTEKTRDGLMFTAMLKAFDNSSSWESAAAEYVKRVQDERLR